MSQVGKRQSLALLTALMTMFALLAFPTGSALAADVNIDCGTEDLQVAIVAATPGDTIIIADGTTCTGNFTVGKALTIRAATAAGATLDGDDVDGAPVLDITPTLLALLGKPVGRDMDGRALTEIMSADFLAEHPPSYIDSYDSDLEFQETDTDEDVPEELMSRLRALGYVD